MCQVVMNLITNASDALRDEGGTIAVRLEHLRPNPASARKGVRKLPEGDFLRVQVRDSGCGMSEEVQSRMFDPFFSTKRAGRGMGLAAVRGIVQSHGGTIQVQSTVGSGSCFEVLLPCVTNLERASNAVGISSSLNGGDTMTATVLMIDDEDALRLPVASMLRRRGFSILETGDGATGVDLFRAHAGEIDIVLLDLTLPGMSGADVLAELRRLQPGITIVLSTAYGREKAMAELNEPESVYYLRKPYRIQEVAELLATLSGEISRAAEQGTQPVPSRKGARTDTAAARTKAHGT